jgi:uncharacterized repeat protein (TIGR01451 family)
MSARSRYLALLIVVVSAAVALIAPSLASAAKVANPGNFTATVTGGFLRIGDQTFGFDPNNPITMSGNVDSAGNVNIPQSGMNFPAMPVSTGGFDLTVHINPAAPVTGSLNPLTGAASLRLKVWIKIDGVPLGSGCRVASASAPIDVNALITGTTSPPGPNTPISGVPYDDSNGKVTVVNNDYSVPSSSDCGLAAGTVNSSLGLPSASGRNEANFELGISPILKKGITASLATSGTSGVRPYTVDFDASASTRTAALRNYQWDFDGNGTFDRTTSGPTTSFTYTSAGTYQAKVRHTDVDGDFAEATKTITVANPPDLSVDSQHTDPFRIGTADHYDVVVKNATAGAGAGPTFGGITVTDVVPSGLTITGVSGSGWTCSTASQTVTCSRPGPIAAGATAPTIRIDVDPTTAALPGGTNAASVNTSGDTNPANNTDLDPTTVTAIDLAIDKSHQGTFRPGSGPTNVYDIDVENIGSAATTGPAVVTDTLPSGLTYVSATGTDWTCGAVGQVITCTHAGSIAAGASADTIEVQVDATIPSGTASTVTNSASVATVNDAFGTNNTDSDETLIIDSPDVSITKSHAGNLTAGSTAHYTLAVANDGPQPTAGTTTVTDTLPTGLTPTAASGTGWTCNIAGQDVTCDRSDVIDADTAAPDIELQATVGLDAIPSVTNTASVSTPGDDNPSNDSSSDPAIVRAIDLEITKSHAQPLRLGRTGHFQLDVKNIGDSPTVDTITVADTVPAGLTPTAASGTGWNCNIAGQDVTCTRNDSLADGDSLPTIDVAVDVGAGAVPGVSNTATVDTTDDYNPNNDSSTDEAAVVEVDAAVGITRTGDFHSASTGTYLVSVDNDGVADTTGTTSVTVDLTAGLTAISAGGSGWSCTLGPQVSCDYAATIPSESSVPDIHLQVAIAANAPSNQTAVAQVTTAGDRNPDNDLAVDTTIVTGPDLTVSSSHTGDFKVGTNGSYTLSVHNGGSAPTTGETKVVDTLPAGLSFVSASGPGWDCSEAAGTVTCTRTAEIANGESAPDITLVVHAASEAAPQVYNELSVETVGDQDDTNDTNSDLTIVRMIDLRIALDRNGEPVVGDELTYEIAVDNVGDAATTGPAVVTDSLPAGITPNEVSGSGWDCSISGQDVSCHHDASLAPTEQAGTISITGVVDASVADTVVNSASVATTNDGNPANDSDDDTVDAVRTPDLSITLDDQIDQNDAIKVGDPVDYRVVVRNEGGSPTTGESHISMELGKGLTYDSADVVGGWACTGSGRLVDCSHPAGIADAAMDTLHVKANSDNTADDEAETIANVNTTGDSDASDDDARVTTKVGRVDFALTKEYGTGPFVAGSQATYDLTVANVGNASNSKPIVVRDELPEGLSLASATGNGWSCRGTGDEAVCTRQGAIAGKAKSKISVTVDVGDSAVPSVSAGATVANEEDVKPLNDSSSDTVDVLERPEDREASKVGARLAMKRARPTKNGIVYVRLLCPVEAVNGCTGDVSLESAKPAKSGKGKRAKGGKSLGSAAFDITQGHTQPVPIRLSAKSLRALAKAGSMQAKVVITPTGLVSTSESLELRSRKR